MNHRSWTGRPFFAVAGVILLVSSICRAAEPVKFEPTNIGEVNAFTLSEDGKFLVVVQRSCDQVLIYEVASGKQVKAITCPKPTCVMVRGNDLFVGQSKVGLSIFRIDQDFTLAHQVATDSQSVASFSAPRGESYRGKAMVCTFFSRSVYLLDATKGSLTKVARKGGTFAGMDCTGKIVLDPIDPLGKEDVGVTRFEDYLKNGPSAKRCHLGRDIHPYQVQPGQYWLAGRNIYAAEGFTLRAKDLGLMLVGDITRPVFYAVGRDSLTAYRLDESLSKAGATVLANSGELEHLLSANGASAREQHALGATVGGQTYLFLHFDGNASLYKAQLPAFAVPAGLMASSQPDTGPPPEIAEFKAVPLEDRVTAMAMTEDGRNLLVGMEAANKVVIFDVATGQAIKTVRCPSPRFILARGTKAYVANFGKGTVTVLAGPDWKVADEVQVGHPEPYFLSAPRGRFFRGQIIACCGRQFRLSVCWLDVQADQHKLLNEQVNNNPGIPAWVVDYAGTCVLSKSYGMVYQYDKFINGQMVPVTSDIRLPNDRGLGPLIQQYHDNGIWVGGPRMYAGEAFPVMVGQPDQSYWAIPDVLRPICYFLDRDGLEARQLDPQGASIGRKRATPPRQIELPSHGAMLTDPPPPVDLAVNWSPDEKNFIIVPPAAATLDGTLYLYVYDHPLGQLFRCRTTAFGQTVTARSGPEGVGTGPFPTVLSAGRKLLHRLDSPVGSTGFTLVKGPAGITIDGQGVLTWTPQPGDVGQQELKIRYDKGGELGFIRCQVEVVPAGLGVPSVAAGPDSGSHFILSPDARLSYSADYKSVVLVSGRQVRYLDADGLTVLRETRLTQAYGAVFDRSDELVAFQGKTISLLSKQTGETSHRIELDFPQILDVAADPCRRVTYAAVVDNSAAVRDVIDRFRVAAIDEKTGSVKLINGLYGQFLAADPRGRFLFAGLHGEYTKGLLIDLDYGAVWTQVGDVDGLAAFDLSAGKLAGVNVQPGRDGRRMRVSPDGRVIAYLARGYQQGDSWLGSSAVAAFEASDVKKLTAVYDLRDDCLDLAFHPVLDLVAGLSSKGITLFDLKTGKPLVGVLDTSDEPMTQVQQVMFAPSGRRLLVDYVNKSGRRVVRSFPLQLDARSLDALASGPKPPAGLAGPIAIQSPAATQPSEPIRLIPAGKLQALQPAEAAAKLSAKGIGQQFGDSVVMVESPDGGGSGFFVGSEGYIITCAHVLADRGMAIHYRVQVEGRTVNKSAPAEVIRVDRENDLALLKIPVIEAVNPVRLAVGVKIEAGEEVTVIGHPGLGELTLKDTMTTGVVSNPKQELSGQSYVQTSATINPGNSGGPMFDTRGRVIGVVVIKGRIEKAGFAVPVERLVEFLRGCVKKD